MAETPPALHESAARGFTRAADDYERGRPTYPAEAIAFLARVLGLAPTRTVLDLAAGTGKLTRALAPHAGTLLAVEPVAAMRMKLKESQPQAEALAGSAEQIPLADGSVDAVTVGQAFHWFDGDAALAEIRRLLRPDGRLGLVWNARDEALPWVARLTELMEPHRGETPGYRAGDWRLAFERTTLFTPLEHAEFRLEHELSPEGVVARVASVSFIAALPDAAREDVLGQVRKLLAEGPETRGRATVVLRYRTGVYWCGRR
ncbi:MAG: class I SAM-dependent methyltransferase [Candidatus Limnocylindria bacterium]